MAERRAGVLSRWSKLKSSLAAWRNTLGQSLCLQQFMREAGEVGAWMAEKMQTASDESYKDPTNLSVRGGLERKEREEGERGKVT